MLGDGPQVLPAQMPKEAQMGTKGITKSDLVNMGFKPVFNTTETFGGNKQALVLWGHSPLSWGYNNGVAVVYDEDDRPWLKHRLTGEEMRKLHATGMPSNAYVPHSNDGGRFVREVLPNLF